MKPIQNIDNLLMSKPARDILIHLGKREDYSLHISRNLRAYNSSVNKYIGLLIQFKLIEPGQNIKKRKYYGLTEKGLKLVKLFRQIDLVANEKEK